MDTTAIAVSAAFLVVLVVYLLRRKSRLKAADDE